MTFDYSAVSAGIRDASREALLAKMDADAQAQIVERARIADQADPVVIASDAEYEALMVAIGVWCSIKK